VATKKNTHLHAVSQLILYKKLNIFYKVFTMVYLLFLYINCLTLRHLHILYKQYKVEYILLEKFEKCGEQKR
jgi:hypothetical protein